MMRRFLGVTSFLLLVMGLSAGSALAGPVVVTSHSPAWVIIGSPANFTFGLPANLSGINCGTENETDCEPTGVFSVNDQFVTSGFVTMTDTDTANGALAVSDVITWGNENGVGVLRFFSDPNLPAGIGISNVLCEEASSPAGNGCIGHMDLALLSGNTLSVDAASDTEIVFDPFGLGADSSDEIRFTGAVIIGAPEPATLTLAGMGLLGLAGLGLKKRSSK